jgi:predicted transcriptional regulator
MRPQLAKIADDLKNGRPVPPVTTREFLSWFSALRRGYWVVRSIREELEKAGLQTVPDFESAWIDAPIELRRVVPGITGKAARRAFTEEHIQSTESDGADTAPITALVSKDPTYRISKLDAANQSVLSVKPDASLEACITILMSRDFSQLPVMTSDREVKGMITWKSIGSRLALADGYRHARDFMIQHHEIRANASIFDAIPVIVSHEYVLVRGIDNRIVGIITATDLSQQFRALSEPFLLLAEIENMIRGMIGDRFSTAELAGARDPTNSERTVESPADLSFGEYIRLLQNDERWQKFGVAIDRAIFCKDLDAVREIRNNVMHFDPEGVEDNHLNFLRDFTNFLKQLQSMFPR